MQDQVLLEFIRAMAQVHAELGSLQRLADEASGSGSSSITSGFRVVPLAEQAGPFDGLEVSVSLDLDVRPPLEGDRHSVGISLAVTYVNSLWEAQGDVGWSSYDFGWEGALDVGEKFASADTLVDRLPLLIVQLSKKFKEIAGLERD